MVGLGLIQWLPTALFALLHCLQISFALSADLDLPDFPSLTDVRPTIANSSIHIRFQGLESSISGLQGDLQTLIGWKKHFLEKVTQNPNASNWLSSWNENDTSPCSWNGIVCGDWQNEQRVTVINMTAIQLLGTLPTEGYSNLTGLQELYIAANNLNGSVPRDIALLQNLQVLYLASNTLVGEIPGELGTILTLRIINLSNNVISSNIPSALFTSCTALRTLNLSRNYLTGPIPYLGNCRNLEVIDLWQNDLQGTIPVELGELPKLRILVLAENGFPGNIPPQLFSNCSSLQVLQLGRTQLTGSIPREIGNCRRMRIINVQNNQLCGSVPSEIVNLQNLYCLALGNNSFTGPIPEVLSTFLNLSILDLSQNMFTGSVPQSFINLQQMEYLALQRNKLAGEFPSVLTNLRQIRSLDVSNNSLEGFLPPELQNLSKLEFLYIAANGFTGEIPPEIGSISTLQVLDAGSNKLTGSIPLEIGNLKWLLWLNLMNNELSGEIPVELGNCASLIWVNLHGNSFSGEIPDTFGNIGAKAVDTFLFNQQSLYLVPCELGECGAIERWLPGTYSPAQILNSENTDEGRRCRVWWNLVLKGQLHPVELNTPLAYLDLSDNRFTGSIPPEIGQRGEFSILLLYGNRLTGPIPSTFRTLPLYTVNFSHNYLNGSIPESLGLVSSLMDLDLSYNNLSGPFPPSMGNLTFLDSWNASYNNLSGPVPSVNQFATFRLDAYTGNPFLCYDLPEAQFLTSSKPPIPECKHGISLVPSPGVDGSLGGSHHRMKAPTKISLIVCSPIFILALAAIVFWFTSQRRTRVRKSPEIVACSKADSKFVIVGSDRSCRMSKDMLRIPVASFGADSLPRALSYVDLLVATDYFSDSNVIGAGGFGVVYKAKLADGRVVAIKKLFQDGAQGDREFAAEMVTLGRIRHENLVPLLGCCAWEGEKLLVYKCISNGNLDEWLHDRPGGNAMLDWEKRVQIAMGAARGLAFLHHYCAPVIIHRDMKASNILLDDSFSAYVTDFGLARRMYGLETHVSTIVAGTLGYVPPEYSQTWRSTTKGDVYSYGVVLLELVTGKRPTGVEFGEKYVGGNMIEWVRILISNGRHEEAIDPSIRSVGAAQEILYFMKLGLLCTDDSPSNRPTMSDVSRALEMIQTSMKKPSQSI